MRCEELLSSSTLPVRMARIVRADPELGDRRPGSSSSRSRPSSAAPSGPVASVRRPRDRERPTGSFGIPTPAIVRRPRGSSQARSSGEMNPSRRAGCRTRRARSARPRPRSRCALQPHSQVAAVRARDRPPSGVHGVGDRIAATPQLGHVGDHQPGEISSVSREASRPALRPRRRLREAVWESDWTVGAERRRRPRPSPRRSGRRLGRV